MILCQKRLVSSKFTMIDSKAEEKGINVTIQDETYTSKTYNWCGNIQNIGRISKYKCKNCRIKIDRFNGARGIFLRALS
ncbi:hypothetical protein C1646_693459 [Rhizophagus diaphanus]|nr:hypothetical protein C1646_693459 [Rhizophagus diaphanus] [Rhizophagus sp. MUCL 43196]